MNENNKKNEYEITKNSSNKVKLSNNYPKVPLVNTKDIKLQDMNVDTFEITWPLKWDSSLTWITAVYNVMGICVTVANPVVGVPILILGSLLPLLWSKDEEDPTKEIWNGMLSYAEALIDEKISENNKVLALAELDSLKRSLDEYESALKNFKDHPEDIHAKNILLDRFEFLYSIFVNRMAIFKPEGDETLLLSIYAEAANLHLILIRDAMMSADDWGLDKNYYHNQLLNYTEEYVNHCVNWYNNGLYNLRYDLLKNSNKKYFTKAKDWKKYNDYRNFLITTVLDIISLFSTYDIYIYPVYKVPKEKENLPLLELTREIYTSPTGYDCDALNTDSMKDDLEEKFTRKPHLFDFLHHINLNSYDKKDRESYLVGNANWYYNTGNNGNLSSSLYSNPDIPLPQGEIEFSRIIGIEDNDYRNSYVYKIITSLYSSQNMTKIHFIEFNIKHDTYDFPEYYYTNEENSIYDPNLKKSSYFIPEYSHMLSHILTYPINRDLITSVFAWTYKNINRENIIYKDRITQIPAVKAYDIWSDGVPGEVIKGPGHTGGDLVKLQLNSSIKVKFKYETKEQKCTIRLRYATKQETTINISTNYDLKEVTLDNTNEKNLEYNAFKYKDVFTIDFHGFELDDELKIYVTKGDVIIDKIEFIPETQQS